MARKKVLLAICLALVLAVSFSSSGWAETPTGDNTTAVPTDGGEGHPWDDGTGGNNATAQDGGLESLSIMPLIASLPNEGASFWVRSVMIRMWFRYVVAQPRIEKDKVGLRAVRTRFR